MNKMKLVSLALLITFIIAITLVAVALSNSSLGDIEKALILYSCACVFIYALYFQTELYVEHELDRNNSEWEY